MKNPEWFWDWTAKTYDSSTQREEGDEWYSKMGERLSTRLEPHHKVLDFACGTGILTFKIAGAVKEVHGIDTSPRMIELAHQRARERAVGNVQFSRRTIFDEALGAASFDVVLAFNVLHLVEDPGAVLRRAGELTRPGGLVVSVTPCAGDAGRAVRMLLSLPNKIGLLPYFHKLRIADVSALVSEAGLEVVESDVLQDTVPSSFVIAQKP